MKSASFILAGVLCGCSSVPIQPSAGHIVLDAEHALAPSFWIPSKEEIRELESDLAALFAKPDQRLSNPTRARLSSYFVKYYGSVIEGRKVIVAAGSHSRGKDFAAFVRENTTPGEIALSASGGGTSYFTAYYDPAARRVLLATFNAAL